MKQDTTGNIWFYRNVPPGTPEGNAVRRRKTRSRGVSGDRHPFSLPACQTFAKQRAAIWFGGVKPTIET